MRKLLLLILFVLTGILTYAQTYSYEVKMDNFEQVSESEFQYDIFLRKGATSTDFALYAMQCRWSYNTALVNGGIFHNDYLTIVGGSNPTGTQLYQVSGWFNSAHFTYISSQNQLNWATITAPVTNDPVTIIDATWRKVCRFSVKIRNAGNTAFHNFADVDPQFAFELSGLNLIVRRCDTYSGSNPGAIMTGVGNSEVLPAGRVVIPALGVKVNTRELAGYYFTGSSSYSSTASWNNITSANYHTVPTSANNAIIAGAATVSDTRVAKDVTVASGGYLVVAPGAKYTTNNLYNDNTGSGGGTATVAGWDFENTGKTVLPYTADNGILMNVNTAPFSTTASFVALTTLVPGGTRVLMANNFYSTSGFPPVEIFHSWNVQLSTTGYQAIKISSKQWSDNGAFGSVGPTSFKLQYSLNGTTWTDVTGGTIAVAQNWTSGVLNNLDLPAQINDLATVYLRWLNNGSKTTGYSAIDDIIITGTALPTGINIQSSSGGATGSLIHNNPGVEATVERYIAGNINDYQGWHFLSSPVAAQPISAFHTAGSGDDFYKWDETAPDSKKWINRTVIGGGLNGDFETNFVPGRGYLVAFRENSTKTFSGALNVGDNSYTGLTYTGGTYYPGWHLLGNPYASALKFNQGSWNRTNVSSIAQIWKEATASYKVLTTAMEIPSMNGFMVYTTGNGSITIPADARIHSDSNWYKQAQSFESIVLVADDPEGGTSQETMIRFDPQSTEGYDFDLDSYYLAGYAPAFYSKSLGKNYALNTLPAFDHSMVIPLGFVKNGLSLFSIRLDRNISGVRPVLRDLKLNIDQDLSVNPVYHFSSENGDNANRFELRFASVGMAEMAMQPVAIYSKGKTITIESRSGIAIQGQVIVYNLLGQEIKNQPLANGPVTTLNVDVHHSGLIVKVQLDQQICSGKVFIQ